MTPDRLRPRARSAVALSLIALAALPALAALSVPAPADPEALIAEAVSADRARSFIHELVAMGPRMGGTRSGRAASDRVRSRFEEIGLEARVEEDPTLDVHEEDPWEAILIGPEKRSLQAWPCGWSAASRGADVEIRLEPPRETGGSPWALLASGNLASEIGRARSAGASALLWDGDRSAHRAGEAAPAVEIPRERRAVVPCFSLSANDGDLLRREIAAKRPPRARLAVTASSGSGSPRTVLADLRGTKPGYFLVCAHGDSDSGGPGADDNASGVASVLETAAALAAAASKGALPAERPGVRFAVWGSEVHSPRAYIARHGAELERLLGVFNYDQTGTSSEQDAIYFEGNDVPWNEEMLKTLDSIAAERAGRGGFPLAHATNPSLGGTDAYAFLPRRFQGLGLTDLRIPSTTVFTSAWGRPQEVPQTPGWSAPPSPGGGKVRIDYSRYYHTSADRPETTTDLHPDHPARCARAVALAIRRLMTRAAER